MPRLKDFGPLEPFVRPGLALAMVIALAADHAMAADRPDDLIQGWYEANDDCRVATGNIRSVACERRSILGDEIEKTGWCYGRTNETLSGGRWTPCKRQELQPRPDSARH